jgi:hypothetical protein
MSDANATHSMTEKEVAEGRSEVVFVMRYIPAATIVIDMHVPTTAKLIKQKKKKTLKKCEKLILKLD